jgi:hypothetical protein
MAIVLMNSVMLCSDITVDITLVIVENHFPKEKVKKAKEI